MVGYWCTELDRPSKSKGERAYSPCLAARCLDTCGEVQIRQVLSVGACERIVLHEQAIPLEILYHMTAMWDTLTLWVLMLLKLEGVQQDFF